MVCLLFMHLATDSILYSEFFPLFYQKFNEYLTESYILAMKHVIEVRGSRGIPLKRSSPNLSPSAPRSASPRAFKWSS